jgi:hypothetical protein
VPPPIPLCALTRVSAPPPACLDSLNSFACLLPHCLLQVQVAAASAARVATLEAELQAERASQAATAADEDSRAADIERMVEAAVAAREEEAQRQVAAAQQQLQQVIRNSDWADGGGGAQQQVQQVTCNSGWAGGEGGGGC